MPKIHAAAPELTSLLDGSSAGELIPELARHGLQQLIELELAAFLGADWHERSEERLGYRNGYRPRTLTTQGGDLALQIPRLRSGSFCPASTPLAAGQLHGRRTRTCHQIRSQADQLIDPESRDVDGNVQDRRGAISVFNDAEPDIRECDDTDSETEQVAAWIEQRRSEGLTPREFGIFVRSEAEIPRAEAALQLAELPYERLQPSAMRLGSKATLSTMHLAKGLEFRAVIVMACDEDVIPNAERIKAITDESDLDEVVATERHLLYVACTRARDHLLITSGDTCSEFVEDLLG